MALIKCPQCGRDISSKALACPHCGLRMEDNIMRYLQDKEYYPLHTEASIPDVGKPQAAHTFNQHEPQHDSYQAQSANQHAYHKLNNKKRNMLLAICLIAVAVIISVTVSLYLDRQKTQAENTAYKTLMDNFSVADAETFLLKYPKSQYTKDIEDNIKLYRRYEQEWKAIANSTSVHDFASFRSRFPDSPFDHKAYDKIDSLDWVSAKKSGTENALQNYLDLHPDGKYADLAQDAKQAIIDSKPSTEEQTIISNNIMRYFVAITDNSKEALSPITTAMGYDKGCESIDAHANTGIYNYIIASPINIVKTPQSAENKYNATFMVQCISTNIEGISIRKEYTVKTTLNSDMLINAVNMRATAQ